MTKKDKDIFDKIMDWKIFGWFRPFYVKNKEMLLYLFFGVLTTAVSFVTAGISKVLLEQAGMAGAEFPPQAPSYHGYVQ